MGRVWCPCLDNFSAEDHQHFINLRFFLSSRSALAASQKQRPGLRNYQRERLELLTELQGSMRTSTASPSRVDASKEILTAASAPRQEQQEEQGLGQEPNPAATTSDGQRQSSIRPCGERHSRKTPPFQRRSGRAETDRTSDEW